MNNSHKNTLGLGNPVPAIRNVARRTFLKRTGAASLAVVGAQFVTWELASAEETTSSASRIQWKNLDGNWEDLLMNNESQITVVGRKAEFRVLDSADKLIAPTVLWKVGGNWFIDFEPTSISDGYSPTNTPKTLPATNPVTFYWAEPSIKSGSSLASPAAHVVSASWGTGASKSAEGSLRVIEPSATLTGMQGISYSCISLVNSQNVTVKYTKLLGVLQSDGTYKPGMAFTAKVETSSLPSKLQAGMFSLCQTVNWDRRYSSGTPLEWQGKTTEVGVEFSDDGIILDKAFPLSDGNGVTTVNVGPNTHDWADFPGGNLDALRSADPDANGYYVNDSFQTYLMFKPAGTDSKWVPLLKLDWSWKGRAAYSSSTGWFAQPPAAPTQSMTPAAKCYVHPRWASCTAGDVPYKPYPTGEGNP